MAALEPDWQALQHAYGDATEVPRWLAAVHSPDAAAREEALEQLWSALCHQETVYPASAAAVPAIAALAVDEAIDVKTRLSLLQLVIYIGRGEDTAWRGYSPREVALEARQAVRRVVPDLLSAAADQPDAWRALLLGLCAYHPEAVAETGVELEGVVPTGDQRLSAAAELTTTLLAGEVSDRATLESAARSDPDAYAYYHEVLADEPPEVQARQLAVELTEHTAYGLAS